MNLQKLQYFLVVCEELNFTRAAQRLYISQQCLSRHIQKLEDEFSVSLFNRTQPLSLTPAGLSLQKNAGEMLKTYNNALQELADIRSPANGEIHLGVSVTRGKYILPPILSAYCKKFPDIHIKLMEGSSNNMEEALLTGKIDLHIGLISHDSLLINSIRLCVERLYAVVPKCLLQSRYGANAANIHAQLQQKFSLEPLKDCPVISMPPEFNIGRFITKFVHEQKGDATLLLETANVETSLALSLQGLGISIVPMIFITEEMKKQIHIYPIFHSDASYTLTANYLKSRVIPKHIFEFISISQLVMKEMASE